MDSENAVFGVFAKLSKIFGVISLVFGSIASIGLAAVATVMQKMFNGEMNGPSTEDGWNALFNIYKYTHLATFIFFIVAIVIIAFGFIGVFGKNRRGSAIAGIVLGAILLAETIAALYILPSIMYKDVADVAKVWFEFR